MKSRTFFLISVSLFMVITLGSEMVLAEEDYKRSAIAVSNDHPFFSFVVWGHPRGRSTGDSPLHFEEILNRITELKANLLIITGDAINGMWGKTTDPKIIREEWEFFDAGVKTLGIPVYRLPGNHDVHNNITRDIYLERYPRVPYAFTFKGSRFIFLDTAGLKQVGKNDQATWDGLDQPFDDEQFRFIKDEISRQERYNHIFVFTHNPQPWLESSTFWWKKIHPLLRNGKTRAVFSGSPWYFKYAYQQEDDINYILSSCLSVPSKELLRMIPDPEEWAIHKQLDNIQYVLVEGNKYTIRTIAVGSLNSPQLNCKFWDEVEKKPPRWTKKIMVSFHKKFYRLRNLAILTAVFGGGCFLLGLFLPALWIYGRWRKEKKSK